MELIYYKGINRLGHVISGQLVARDPEAARVYLLGINVSPVLCQSQSVQLSGYACLPSRFETLFTRGNTKTANPAMKLKIAEFSNALAKLLEGGVPVHEALLTLKYSERNFAIAQMISSLLNSIAQGQKLSDAMVICNTCFDEAYIKLIAVGEKVGNLQHSLMQLGESLTWRAEFEKRLRSAMIYPALVAGLLVLILLFLLIAVVPSLTDFLLGASGTVPWHTGLLIHVSDVLLLHWQRLLILLPLTIILILWLGQRISLVAGLRDRLLLRLPFVGQVLLLTALARYTHQLALLYRSGVDILQALDAAMGVVVNEKLKESAHLIRLQIADGVSVSDSMRSTGVFMPSSIQIVEIGEQTGKLSDALEQVSSNYWRVAGGRLQAFEAAVAPAMMMFVGLFLIWMILSIFAPIYNSAINSGVLL